MAISIVHSDKPTCLSATLFPAAGSFFQQTSFDKPLEHYRPGSRQAYRSVCKMDLFFTKMGGQHRSKAQISGISFSSFCPALYDKDGKGDLSLYISDFNHPLERAFNNSQYDIKSRDNKSYLSDRKIQLILLREIYSIIYIKWACCIPKRADNRAPYSLLTAVWHKFHPEM